MGNLAILARISPLVELFRPLRKKEQVKIVQALDRRLVAFLDVDTRDDAIDALVDLLDKEKRLPDKERFRQAILHREQLVSTGIGMGVAVPHAKLKDFSRFFIAVGIQRKKGIDWNALDKAPVWIIFMIGGPEDKQAEYLQILSQITSAVKNVELRRALLKARSSQEVLNFFSGY